MRNKWIWASAAIVAAGLAAWWWVRDGPVPVAVVTPVRGPAVEAIYATGSVEPTVSMPIAPRVAGRLVELNTDEGRPVRKGEVLARIDDSDLVHTVTELAARAKFARAQYDRTKSLVARGFVSEVDLDRARSDLDAAEASLQRAQAQRDFAALVSPADGIIIKRDGEIGQFIPVGQPVFYLSCCAPLRVSAEVDEEDIPRVHVGQKVVLRADALPGRVFDGEVSEVTPKGDPVARTYRVRIRLADPAAFRIGMTVDANLVVSRRDEALLVPSSAVKDNSVWTVAGGKLHRQPVKTGVTGSGHTEIVSGLTSRAEVVAEPGDGLREGRGARVRAAK
ncbi:MAG TPA: efflux RND transporter periplasmic adaptor subunit [Usitatibacter sp.]|nr:efflux RND transporter periplasmic adaptor subunit [Usitatibacter sp.]